MSQLSELGIASVGVRTALVEVRGLLTPQQLSKLLGLTPRALARWRKEGIGPAFIRFDDAHGVRYRAESVEAWLAQREGFQTTAKVTKP